LPESHLIAPLRHINLPAHRVVQMPEVNLNNSRRTFARNRIFPVFQSADGRDPFQMPGAADTR
jgi:hypothetical protein